MATSTVAARAPAAMYVAAGRKPGQKLIESLSLHFFVILGAFMVAWLPEYFRTQPHWTSTLMKSGPVHAVLPVQSAVHPPFGHFIVHVLLP